MRSPPTLEHAFTLRVTLAPPLEMGVAGGGRRRFIPITGGTVSGPRLQGMVLPGGGDWQTILPDGLTRVEAHYALRADDGTVIEVHNPGLRVASPEVSEQLARGEMLAPDAYYFRTTPRFTLAPGPHGWLMRQIFIARGIRLPDEVRIDVHAVG